MRALLEYRYPRLFVPQFLGGRGRHPGRKTSLTNLLRAARDVERGWGREEPQKCVWILCDADENDVHRAEFERWTAKAPERHRVAMQAASIEAWFLQHLDRPSRPATNDEAVSALAKQWVGYTKGCEIPEWLIERTDRALHREAAYLQGRGGDDLWPVARSSQVPRFIAYLDNRARLLGWWGTGAQGAQE